MTTIQIVDPVHQREAVTSTNSSDAPATGVDHHSIYTSRRHRKSDASEGRDGIYNIRSRSAAPSIERREPTLTVEDGDPGLQREGDFKQKQIFTGKMLLWLSYQSIGVIYGDIGTSPLYVYSSTFSSPPSRQDVIGALSLIMWSLFMMVMNITNRDPREASLVQMKRYMSEDLHTTGRYMRQGLESSKFARGLLKVMGVLAVTMVLSDGVLTPAQSVLGAVQGIQVVDSSISKSTIVGVTDAILVVLFLVQPLGITKITHAFAPIIIIWLAFNAVFGMYNLAKHDAGVFKAFNPYEGFHFLIRYGEEGWRKLGGILLSFTGVEALFADLGAFSRRAVQLSWLCYVFPCLLLAYLGQAAYICDNPEAYSNPFFNAAPPGTVYPSLVMAILAAILLAQIMKLSYFPQIKVVHTSKIFHGQLYVPAANWLLMIGTILIASIYNNTTSLGNAYGVCVMFVTFFDTCMTSMVAIFVWRISPYLVFLPWLAIASMDGAFLSASLTKVPQGAWFTLTLAAVLAGILLLWRFGKEQQWAAEAEDRFPTSHFIRTNKDGSLRLSDRYQASPISSTRGLGIFFDKAGETTPIVFSQFVLKLTSVPEVIIFFHLRPLETPSVGPEDRHTVSRLGLRNCYRLVVRYGYNDEIISPDLAAVIVDQVRNFLMTEKDQKLAEDKAPYRPVAIVDDTQEGATTYGSSAVSEKGTEDIKAIDDILALESAYQHKVLYIMGKEQMKITKTPRNYLRNTLLHVFLWFRENTRNKMANLRVPTDKAIEVGFLKEI
ncbi:hypothetical protein DV738_g4533, partial [Chaetothyriales sp. CBS 135597]